MEDHRFIPLMKSFFPELKKATTVMNSQMHTIVITSLMMTSTTLCCSTNCFVFCPNTPHLVNWIPRSLTTNTDSKWGWSEQGRHEFLTGKNNIGGKG